MGKNTNFRIIVKFKYNYKMVVFTNNKEGPIENGKNEAIIS